MKRNKEELDSDKLSDETMNLAIIKSHEMIQNIIMTYIWPKLCTVKKIAIPNDIPKLEFDKLLSNIFSIFKQNDTTFPENLKLTIKELVLETLKTLCNDATNYILEKVETTDKIPQDIKIFKTKIIINKNIQNNKISTDLYKKTIQLYIPICKRFKNKLNQVYVPYKKHILLQENNRHTQTKINKAIGESFGKINSYTNEETSYNTQKNTLEKIKLSELENWYTYADFHEIQILNGIFNFIDESKKKIRLIPQNERKKYGITEHENKVIEFTTPINKTFFNFFTEYNDKRDKNGNFTQVQTRTKQRILKMFCEIQTLELPVRITNEKTIFIRPIHIKGIETLNKKTFLTIKIDTKILLLQSYHIKKMAFFLVISKDKIFKLNKIWDDKIKAIEKTNQNKWKIFKDYRLNQLKDLVIKGYNILQHNCHKTSNYYIPINISKDNWNNKLLPERRFDEHLIKNNHYKKTSRRTVTIDTKNNLRRLLNELLFETLEEGNCLRNRPKVTNNIYRFRANPREFNPAQAHKKILIIKNQNSRIPQTSLK
jgi:hypothetical protein